MQRRVTFHALSRQFTREQFGLHALIAGLWIASSACSADKPVTTRDNWNPNGTLDGGTATVGGVPTAARGGSGGAFGSRAAGSSASAPVTPGIGSITGGNGAFGEVEACVQAKQQAQEIPIDMYIMLDRSSSMDELTGAGPSKWTAIRSALRSFLTDSRSDGLGVGLQFFPIATPGVPEQCDTDSQCGPGGPCLTGICQPTGGDSFRPVQCATDADCPEDTAGCTTNVGVCGSDENLWCFNVGPLGCGFGDPCLQLNLGSCKDAYSCAPTDYAAPAVEIAALPGNSNALVDTLSAERTLGTTPTSAALSGALLRAKQYAQSQPTHRVIAVLATDGLPTECEPLDAPAIASIAAAGQADTPAVSTYVIGVFASSDTGARTNLNSWAKAGGTQTAFIIDPSSDVSAQFLDALDNIRSGSIACEYQLPDPPTVTDQLDFDRVNVVLIEGPNTTDFLYVEDATRCDSVDYGWYYDVKPSSGKPTKIVVCSKACDSLKSTTATGRVEVRVGCVTHSPD